VLVARGSEQTELWGHGLSTHVKLITTLNAELPKVNSLYVRDSELNRVHWLED
jgi:hypothetical protein